MKNEKMWSVLHHVREEEICAGFVSCSVNVPDPINLHQPWRATLINVVIAVTVKMTWHVDLDDTGAADKSGVCVSTSTGTYKAASCVREKG